MKTGITMPSIRLGFSPGYAFKPAFMARRLIAGVEAVEKQRA